MKWLQFWSRWLGQSCKVRTSIVAFTIPHFWLPFFSKLKASMPRPLVIYRDRGWCWTNLTFHSFIRTNYLYWGDSVPLTSFIFCSSFWCPFRSLFQLFPLCLGPFDLWFTSHFMVDHNINISLLCIYHFEWFCRTSHHRYS